jgi:DNA-binding transcriptional regulator YiaG
MQLGENCWKKPMSIKLSFKEALGQREGTKEKPQDQSASPIVKLILVPRKIRQPVEVARLLTKYGMSLRKAHDTLDRLAKRDTVAVELYAGDFQKLASDLSALGVEVQLIQVPEIDVKKVRERFGISQAEFALRFGLELDTIRNWEQGRYKPDSAAKLLLKLIETCPAAVEAVLTRNGPLPTNGGRRDERCRQNQ